MTDAQFGLLTSVFLWIYGLLSPFAGYMADKYSRSRVIIISLFVWSLITWFTVHVTTFEQLLLSRALMGISEACYIPAAMALIADYHRGSTRSLATGIHLAGVMTGQSLGFLGGLIAEKQSWTSAFAIIGIVGVVYAVILLFTLKDTTRQVVVKTDNEVNFFTGIKDLFRRRSFILLAIFWSLLGIVGWLILGWLPGFYKEEFHLSQSVAGLYATGYLHPVSLVGVLLGGFLADRWSRTNPHARILLPAIGLCIAAPFAFTGSVTSVLPLAVACFMMYGLTRTWSDSNLMPMLCMIADPRYRATGYGVLNLFACIVGGIGLYAGGVLRDAQVNFSRLFQFASVIMLICAFVLFSLKTARMKR
jgi:MFS family permease